MADFLGLPMSSQTRARFSQLLDMAAPLGIDSAKVAAAGPAALRALLALTHANHSGPGVPRARSLAKVQDALSVLQHRKHPELVQQIQRAAVALHGRGNDSDVAHVTRGEIVVPLQLQTAEVMAALRTAAGPYGIPLDMLRVGTALNRINPETGAPEFGVIDWISGLFKDDSAKTSADRPSSNEAEPKFVFSPPFDDPAVAAEEKQAIKDYLREFPPENNPVLRAAGGSLNRLKGPKQLELLRTGPTLGGIRG